MLKTSVIFMFSEKTAFRLANS